MNGLDAARKPNALKKTIAFPFQESVWPENLEIGFQVGHQPSAGREQAKVFPDCRLDDHPLQVPSLPVAAPPPHLQNAGNN